MFQKLLNKNAMNKNILLLAELQVLDQLYWSKALAIGPIQPIFDLINYNIFIVIVIQGKQSLTVYENHLIYMSSLPKFLGILKKR